MSVAEVVPMRQIAAPLAVTLPANCTNRESLLHALPSALPWTHSRYGTPAVAVKVSSK